MVEGIKEIFSKSKRYINGHLEFSIILILLNTSLSKLFTRLELKAITVDNMKLFFGLWIISSFLTFFLHFFDITFVFTGLDCELNEDLYQTNEEG
ncbi:hypothetical protein KHQ81_04185 [Mycoplasmatota bacterium]|nr:hypothetical protein KHQ81_04185 [Mycoplasmatota bacterium]